MMTANEWQMADRRLEARPISPELAELRALAAQGPNRLEAETLMPGTIEQTIIRLRQLLTAGPSAAIWVPGTILGLGGIAERFPGVGEGWAIIGAEVTRLGLGFRFVRFARRLFADWIRAGHFHRVDCGIPAHRPTVDRFLAWVEALGFAPEARLARGCADGEDVIVCSILPEGNV